ncbi:MAG: ATP-binding protein [Actinomycetota bacterium]|nr:ATP-binding protein [Actinomycetota bacterium]
MPPDDGALVGREDALKTLLSAIREKKSLHIYGPEGTGKSALLNWLHDNWSDLGWLNGRPLIPVFSRNSGTFRETVLSISDFLLGHCKNLRSVDKYKEVTEISHSRDFRKLDIKALRNLIYTHLKGGEFCLILDHLECVTPRINGFLSILYEQCLVISASRQNWEYLDYGFKGHIGYALNFVPKLKIENLSKTDALTLMEQIAGRTRFEDGLLESVYQISHGNPGLIQKIMRKALLPGYRTGGGVNLKLILIDLEIEKIGKGH